MMNESTVDTKTIQVPTTPYKIGPKSSCKNIEWAFRIQTMVNKSSVNTEMIQLSTTPYKIVSSQTTLSKHNQMSNRRRDTNKMRDHLH
jgi:hypothetical protein